MRKIGTDALPNVSGAPYSTFAAGFQIALNQRDRMPHSTVIAQGLMYAAAGGFLPAGVLGLASIGLPRVCLRSLLPVRGPSRVAVHQVVLPEAVRSLEPLAVGSSGYAVQDRTLMVSQTV